MAVVVVVLVGAVVSAVILTSGGKKADTAHGGRQAPGFTLPNLQDGKGSISLASYRGTPVLVNFWATWCQPCTQEMPLLQAAHKRVGDKVVFLGIDRQDFRADAQNFLRRTGVTYAAAYDRDGSLDIVVVNGHVSAHVDEDGASGGVRQRRGLHRAARALRIVDPLAVELERTSRYAVDVLAGIDLARVAAVQQLIEMVLRLHVLAGIAQQADREFGVLNAHLLGPAFAQ